MLLAALLWGTTGTAASLLPADVSPIAVGAATMCVGGLLFFLVFLRPSWAVLRWGPGRGWVLLGALSTFAYPLAFYSSMHLAGVALGTVVTLGSAPVFAALIERVLDRTVLTRGWMAGTVLAIAGVVLLSFGAHRGPGEHGAGNVVLAVLLALLAGFAYALYTYAAHRVMRFGISPTAAMGAMFGEAGVLLLPVLLLTGAPLLQSSWTIGVSGYLAIGPMYLAYVLFAYALVKVSASAATTITLAEPAIASFLAVAVVGERIDWRGWLGIVLIAAGIVLAAWASSRLNRAPRREVRVAAEDSSSEESGSAVA